MADQQRVTGKTEGRRAVALLFLLLLASALIVLQTLATPSGPTIDYIGNETTTGTGNGTLVDDTDDNGGKIITMNLDAIQQNTHWKAYVGNISGAYALADGAGYSIYEWAVASFTGEVYATRENDVNWTQMVCANETHVLDEMDFYNMSYAEGNANEDNINETFYDKINHNSFTIGDDLQFDDCNWTTAMFVNDSSQTTDFQEILLYDANTENLVYVTIMENDIYGYRNDSTTTYDYQMILPENSTAGQAASATAYYFYVELL